MDHGPLVTNSIVEGEQIVRQFAAVMPLEAAFWMKVPDYEDWRLILASSRVDVDGQRAVIDAFLRTRGPGRKLQAIDTTTWHVMGLRTPFARAILELQQQYPDQLPMRLQNHLLGGRYLEDGWLYAPVEQAAMSGVPS